MLFPLREGLLFPPSGTALEVSSNLANRLDRPFISHGPTVDLGTLLPIPEGWINSISNVRILDGASEPRVGTLTEDVGDFVKGLWSVGPEEQTEEQAVQPRMTGPWPAAYAEIAACWSVTLGCEDCYDDAVARTSLVLTNVLHELVESQTIASGIPLAPLLGEFFRESQVVWVRECWLDGNLYQDHGYREVRHLDPRAFLMDQIGEGAGVYPTEQIYLDATDVMIALMNDREIAPYYRFVAAASRNLYLNNEPSTAVLLASQACESLLDLVLLHILWWDGEDYVAAGQKLSDGIVKRVQSHYMRMRGTWDLATCEPLGNWRAMVTDKRNRVAHGGRSATEEEAAAAVGAANGLYLHLLDVANKEWPRSAYPALAGILKLSAGWGTAKQRKAQEYYGNKSLRPHESFRFYRNLANRERWKANGNPLSPTTEHAETFVTVRRNDDAMDWWLYDPESHHVIRSETPRLAAQEHSRFLEEYRGYIRDGLDVDTISVGVDREPKPAPGAEWVDALVVIPYLSPIRPT